MGVEDSIIWRLPYRKEKIQQYLKGKTTVFTLKESGGTAVNGQQRNKGVTLIDDCQHVQVFVLCKSLKTFPAFPPSSFITILDLGTVFHLCFKTEEVQT